MPTYCKIVLKSTKIFFKCLATPKFALHSFFFKYAYIVLTGKCFQKSIGRKRKFSTYPILCSEKSIDENDKKKKKKPTYLTMLHFF